jgi:microcystin-dependent protein
VADALDGLITRNYAGLTTGTSTAYIATPTPAWDAYTTSGLVVIIPHITNTGASTINISGLGARDLKIGNVAIAAGVLQQNVPTIMAYTGTYFEVLLQQTTIPIGTIYTYAGTAAPVGYLLCDGSSQSTTGTYAALHGVIGYTYGGSGATFNLPDLRRRMPVGKGASDTLGGSDAAAYASRSLSHTHTVPPHYHGMGTGADLNITSSGAHTHTYQTPDLGASVNYGTDYQVGGSNTPQTGSTAHTHPSSSFSGRIGLVTGGVDGNASMTSGSTTNPHLFINYIIKF